VLGHETIYLKAERGPCSIGSGKNSRRGSSNVLALAVKKGGVGGGGFPGMTRRHSGPFVKRA